MSKRVIAEQTVGAVTVKIYRDSEWQEYQCVPFIDGTPHKPSTYFTDDRDDALKTAMAMAIELGHGDLFKG